MTSAIRSGARLDRLAELEEERRFLLRSLRDLEAEHEAGDVDVDDYDTLKDGYTVRAAGVLRQIDAGRRDLAPRQPRRWGRTVAVCAAIVLGAAGVGFALAQAWGERGANQEITGFTPGDDVRARLASARFTMGQGDFITASRQFAAVVQDERARGNDNPEALAYFGWTLALSTRDQADQAASNDLLDASLLSLEQAITVDPNYPDPYCFTAIIEFAFRDDAERALPFIETCEAGNPPADIANIVAGFADDIRAAAAS